MTAWDDDYFYLAIDVTDDVMRVGRLCYEQGLQVAFEVGGPASKDGGTSMAGMLQAKRSTDIGVSQLALVNMGLIPSQSGPNGAYCSTQLVDPHACCVDYELSQQDSGFVRRSNAAVLRNPITDLVAQERCRVRPVDRFGCEGLHRSPFRCFCLQFLAAPQDPLHHATNPDRILRRENSWIPARREKR